jgi:DNA replication protein DnaC
LDDYLLHKIINGLALAQTVCSPECEKTKLMDEAKLQYARYIEIMAYKIPAKFQNIVFRDLVKIDELYAKKRSLYITGTVGTGKTTLAITLLRRYLMNGCDVKFVSYPMFMMQMQSAYRDANSNPFYMADELSKFVGVLCIDDLGAEKITDYIRQITYCIINHREMNMLKTIITSNYNLSKVDTQIDERISSRIAGMCEIVKLTGEDLRLKNKAHVTGHSNGKD